MKRVPEQKHLTVKEIQQRIGELSSSDRMAGDVAAMLASEFNDRTFANMEVALQRACARLSPEFDDHKTRKVIAQKIIECARRGQTSLSQLTAAGADALQLERAAT